MRHNANQVLDAIRAQLPAEEALAAEISGKTLKLDELIQRFSSTQK